MAKEKKERSTDNNCEFVMMKLYGTDDILIKLTANSQQATEMLYSALQSMANRNKELKNLVFAVCLDFVLDNIDQEGDS